jgi:hypothetical protein
MNPPLRDPELPPEHEVDWPVAGSWQFRGSNTAVETTPPPSKTSVIAVERLMPRL